MVNCKKIEHHSFQYGPNLYENPFTKSRIPNHFFYQTRKVLRTDFHQFLIRFQSFQFSNKNLIWVLTHNQTNMKKITLFLFSFLFSIVAFSQESAITNFTLVNANTNEDIVVISEGAEINLLEYVGVQFNIRANSTGDVKSVRLQLSGTLSKIMTENVAPHALYGDSPAGDYRGQLFPVGSYAISAKPYSEASAGGTAGQLLSINFRMVEIPLQRPFITTWKTDNPGASADNQINIPIQPGADYNYSVDWGDGTIDSGVSSSITHTYELPGIYEISISGIFPQILMGSTLSLDNEKLLYVNQWGTNKWVSMEGAFRNCPNLDVIALDIPDLSLVKTTWTMFSNANSLIGNSSFKDWDVSSVERMGAMFSGASKFNQDISSWHVSNVYEFNSMFYEASLFNQDISDWDVSSATDMTSMFGRTNFNQDIGKWDVSGVTEMAGMFSENEIFNQDIGSWNVSNVSSLNLMFYRAKAFNQPIGAWKVSNVTNMNHLFRDANSFNQDISSWDVSNVIDMNRSFENAVSFNTDISVWDVSRVTSMFGMFDGAVVFNQDIGNWDVSNVTNFGKMFEGAAAFNQDLESWNISLVEYMYNMLLNAGLSVENYDNTLIGWSNLPFLQNNVPFHGGNSKYCLGDEARQKLIDDFGWSITDGGKAEDCEEPQRPFVTTWKTDNPGSSEDNQITIPTFPGETYNYSVDWGDGTSNDGVTGSTTHTYEVPGMYQVSISGLFPSLFFNDSWDKNKILALNQWGDNEWARMTNAFSGCVNLKVTAVDTPNLSNVFQLDSMFANCSSLEGTDTFNLWDVSHVTDLSATFKEASLFNADIGDWDVSNVDGMDGLFNGAESFNRNISNWDVGKVESMISMFANATSFNQDIGDWKVDNVVKMNSMFSDAIKFNQDLNNWNVGSVNRMSNMFNGATSFNQDLNNWNVSNVTSMLLMFGGATSFNQDLSNWDVVKVTEMIAMFQGASSFNQDISDWNVTNVLNMSAMFQWANSFNIDLSKWDVSNVEKMVAIFDDTELSTANYDKILLSWSQLPSLRSDVEFGAMNSQYCLGEEARQKLIDDFGWVITDGGKAEDCEIVEQRPFITTWKTDNPGSENNDVRFHIAGQNMNYNVDWGDGNIDSNINSHIYELPGIYEVSITGVFTQVAFNDDQYSKKLLKVNQWGNVEWTSMLNTFNGCENLEIIATDVPKFASGTTFRSMFANCKSIVDVPKMNEWDVSLVTYMAGMFHGAENFNEDISNWDVSNVTQMAYMFAEASSFNNEIGDWNVSKVTGMNAMFAAANSFDKYIGNWDVSNVLNFLGMFQQNTSFNQDIGSWDVEIAVSMDNMFDRASSFDQDLSAWDISNVDSMGGMFSGVTLSTENYDNILGGWSALANLKDGIVFTAGNSQYCLGEEARQRLINDFGWIIADGGIALDCIPCPIEQITLNTQQQVDEFTFTYDVANCTFEGGILIEGTDIVNLDGLSNLTYIDGLLSIRNTSLTNIDGLSLLTEARAGILIESNSVLANVDGLSSITTLSILNISGNASLSNIDGLKFLTQIYSDIVIQNNESLTNLDGLSSLAAVSDSFIIKSNMSLEDIDGLSSFIFIDNDLIIESNPMLENVDGLSSLDAVGLSLSIQFNASLTNLDGLSGITNMYADLSVINNDMLTNVAGLSNLRSIGGNFNISENNALSDCAIDPVCDSDTIVGGTITISGNTGNCADVTVAKAACVQVEAAADLIAATYLQGTRNPEPSGPILRAEEGNREIYLKFDLSSFSGPITLATLQMQVASDPGNGTLEVFLGSNSNWTETGLNGSNKPVAVGSALATITGTHSLGQTKTWNLDVSQLASGGEITLIVKHSNGNDVAFASDETSQAPQLLITSGSSVQRPFITTWKTDNPGISADNQVTIRTFPGETYNYSINWGDGNSDTNVAGDIVHTYAASGTYEIAITGNFPRIYTDGEADYEKLMLINQWGNIRWSSMEQAFAACRNLEVVASDVPNLSQVNSLADMFSNCENLTGNEFFNLWDVSNITNMYETFTSSNFNSDISNWNVSRVTDMQGIFRFTDFNQDIGNWDVGNVQRMSLMFGSNSSFNQDIGNWNVSNVIGMGAMFTFATSFNQDISSWDVSNVEEMGAMFQRAESFNQDIGNWDVSKVNYMYFMLNGASSFDQDLSNWNVSNVTNMENIFGSIILSTDNYDAILLGWSTQQLQNGVIFGGGNSQYCQGEAARQNLIDVFGWLITDGGKSETCNASSTEIWLEAECAVVGSGWSTVNDTSVSNGQYLLPPSGHNRSAPPIDTGSMVSFQFQADAGSYSVHALIKVNSLAGDSFWVRVNSGSWVRWNGMSLSPNFAWHRVFDTDNGNQPVTFNLVDGTNTLDIAHREANTGLDKIYITRTANLPTGFGETDLSCSAGSSAKSIKKINKSTISPNPASMSTTLSFDEPTTLVKVYLYDVLGRLLGSYEGVEIADDGNYILDVQSIPSGTYYVKAHDDDGNQYQKQMIIKK